MGRNVIVLSVEQSIQLLETFKRTVLASTAGAVSAPIDPKIDSIQISLNQLNDLRSNLADKSSDDIKENQDLSSQLNKCDELRSDLRQTIHELMNNKNNEALSVDGVSFPAALFKVLLTLTNLHPYNNWFDGVMLEPIDPENSIPTSDGYVHDIESLTSWFEKYNTNPYTSKRFSKRDIEFISRMLNKKASVSDDDVDNADANSLSNDSDFEQTPPLNHDATLATPLTSNIINDLAEVLQINQDMQVEEQRNESVRPEIYLFTNRALSIALIVEAFTSQLERANQFERLMRGTTGYPSAVGMFSSYSPSMLNVQYVLRRLPGRLSEEDILKWVPNEPGAPFTVSHADVLYHLINNLNLEAELAVDLISRKSESEVRRLLNEHGQNIFDVD